MPRDRLFPLKHPSPLGHIFRMIKPAAMLAAGMVFGLILSSCSTRNIDNLAGMTPDLKLEEFFAGETVAYGIFEDRFGNLKRRFKVNIIGSVSGNTLTLDEDFLYADGERATRIWTITNDGRDEDGRVIYNGTAADIDGMAAGRIVGNGLNWAYDIDLKTDDGDLRVHFDDWIYQMDDHVALNRAYVSKFGIEIGSVTLVFMRGDAAATLGPLDLTAW